jgi:peptidoglycan/xylan/chitin deacetylase (PgdA/CDA1 family)
MGWGKGAVAVLVGWGLLLGLTACGEEMATEAHDGKEAVAEDRPTGEEEKLEPAKRDWQAEFGDRIPRQWGEQVTGVISRLDTDEPVIALTLDACGGEWGSGYDRELIRFLQEKEVPATLFINQRWLRANPGTFDALAADPLFTIENHGTEHRPLSVNGRSVYGIQGTADVEEVVAEIQDNQRAIAERTGREPRFFRSGTAYYDEVAVAIAREMGIQVIHFDIVGDAGATRTADEVERALLSSRPGSIVILHMNQPQSGTAEGVKRAIPRLLEKGYQFVKLDDVL